MRSDFGAGSRATVILSDAHWYHRHWNGGVDQYDLGRHLASDVEGAWRKNYGE